MAKKRQKTIPVPSPSPSPSLSPSLSPLLLPMSLSPAMPVKPIYINKINKGKDENIKEPIKVKDEDIKLLLLLLLIYFISI